MELIVQCPYTVKNIRIFYGKINGNQLPVHFPLLSTPMVVDYVVIGFDTEVQPLVTHNAA